MKKHNEQPQTKKTTEMKNTAARIAHEVAAPVSRFSLTFACGWRTPGEAMARGGKGAAASFGQEWLPGAAANTNEADYTATFYRGRGYVRLASSRS
jgi:hypothetical protein